MSAKVTLTVIEGSLKGQEFIFSDRTTCIIGRAKDCYPRIPNKKDNIAISRYHCLLDINPPDIRIRDFGSKNGTYVNGAKIGQRKKEQTPEEGAQLIFPEYDLQEGDEIKISNLILRVSIQFDITSSPTIDFSLQKNNQSIIPFHKRDLFTVIKNLLNKAKQEEQSLIAIRGYTINKLLGKGDFGEVYLARHNQTQAEVALKVMLPEIAINQRAIDYFLRDIENIKALQHPNIVHLQDSGYSDEIFFFTLEYCSGGSVIDLMRRRDGKLTVDEALSIILQVLDGLKYAHNADIPYVKLPDGTFQKGRGLIHFDIKPANIFLAEYNTTYIAKIGDYGLVKAFDRAGLSGQSMSGINANTPAFIPRQQVIDFNYAKPELDVWAVAACFYYMLTGWLPRDFIGKDPFLAVLQHPPVPIRQRDISIPKKLAEVIDLALVDNPEIYFKNAEELKRSLLSSL